MNFSLDAFLSFLASAGGSLLAVLRSVSVTLGGHDYSFFSALLAFLVAHVLFDHFFGGDDE